MQTESSTSFRRGPPKLTTAPFTALSNLWPITGRFSCLLCLLMNWPEVPWLSCWSYLCSLVSGPVV